jgi:hypothetical protein
VQAQLRSSGQLFHPTIEVGVADQPRRDKIQAPGVRKHIEVGSPGDARVEISGLVQKLHVSSHGGNKIIEARARRQA